MRIRAILGAFVVVAAGLVAVAPAAQASATNPTQLIPGYIYPAGTPNPWHTLCDSANTNGDSSTIIANPASGPGTAANSDYTSAIAYCQDDGVNVVGYVHTTFGQRSLADVKADIDTWYSLYPDIDGIFVDEVQNSDGTPLAAGGGTIQAYYHSIYTYVHNKAYVADVIANPGTDLTWCVTQACTGTEAWILNAPAADETIVFEGSAADYANWSPQSWESGKNANELATLVYSATTTTALGNACNKSKNNNVGLVYVTDDNSYSTDFNPWDTVPSYWTSEAPSVTVTC